MDQSGDRQEGITQSYVLFALNEGKNSIQQALCNARQDLFLANSVITISALTTFVEVPAKTIGQTRVRIVEFSETNSDDGYSKLKKRHLEDYRYSLGSPSSYTMSGAQIKLWPSPSKGFLRVTYQAQDNDLDLRRSVVKTGGMVSAGGFLQFINLDETSLLYDAVNQLALSECDYICLSLYDGTVSFSNIPVASFDKVGNRLVIEAGYAYAGTANSMDGRYISCGLDSSIRSGLANSLQDYVMEWAKYRLQNWDASDQTPANIPILQARKAELTDLYSDPADQESIPLVGNLTGMWGDD